VAQLILQVIADPQNENNLQDVANKVEALTEKYPIQ
jgi:glycine hydroxymethyltransferase